MTFSRLYNFQTQLLVAFFVTTFLPYVSAHGYLKAVAIDGQWYAGNLPNNYKGPSPIRLISDIGPVKGSSNPDLICGLSAAKAELVVNANPGSTVSFQWMGGDGVQKWPHNVGPLMTYMTQCNGNCADFDPTGAKWFKIDEGGKKPNSDQWYQADIQSEGASWNVVLPSDLSPGGYLIRHEIIALHLGGSEGGAEFYPACTQVMIGGNGNGKPQATVLFPGAYSDTDPGIWDQNIYNPGSAYTFPGGAVSNLASGGDSLGSGAPSDLQFPASGGTVGNPTATGGSPVPTASSSDSTQPTTSASVSRPSSSSTGTTDSAPTTSPTGGASTGPGTTCSLKPPQAGGNQRRHFKRFFKRIMPHGSR
jgi:hypothetical protein